MVAIRHACDGAAAGVSFLGPAGRGILTGSSWSKDLRDSGLGWHVVQSATHATYTVSMGLVAALNVLLY